MATFYHLDSTGVSLRAGQVLDLLSLPRDLPPGEATTLSRWFPRGVTWFGLSIIGRHLEPLALEREIEAERVRRDCYADRPSRFVAVFGCREIEDFGALRAQFSLPGQARTHGCIWMIEGNSVFRGDMNVFRDFCHDNTRAAHAFWTQGETSDPLFEYLLEPPVAVVSKVPES